MLCVEVQSYCLRVLLGAAGSHLGAKPYAGTGCRGGKPSLNNL